MLQSQLLGETVQLAANDQVLVLNSAADPFVAVATQYVRTGTLTLAEDNIATLSPLLQRPAARVRHVAFHDYLLHHPAETMDVALLDLLYQPSNAWIYYALQVAYYALHTNGRFYVLGAKDRGILTVAKRLQEMFGNVETLTISRGHRVLCAYKRAADRPVPESLSNATDEKGQLRVFADNKLDAGTRLLLDTLAVHTTDNALDLGCGAGFIGLHIARLATQGQVTLVDASLAAVAVTQQAIAESGLTNARALPSDGVQAVLQQRFDLIATNPPFHQGGIQTTAIAEGFIRAAAKVLQSKGRFYIVANRFLKYEPTLRANFKNVAEVAGDTRYKVLLASGPEQPA